MNLPSNLVILHLAPYHKNDLYYFFFRETGLLVFFPTLLQCDSFFFVRNSIGSAHSLVFILCVRFFFQPLYLQRLFSQVLHLHLFPFLSFKVTQDH
jgi:hypothetical protein